jgi:sugar phosphate isomerase/epimerase
MVREMVDLGFNAIELSHGVRITLVPGVLKAVEEGVVTISSTHNFCPLPTGIVQAAPNLFEPSTPDPREHEQWLRHTKRSIDFAAQVKARVLVCHLGSVKFFWFNPAGRLQRYARRHAGTVLRDDPKYQAVVAKAFAKLRDRMGPYWERTQQCVREVLSHAKLKGVRLGLENRERFDELPVDADFDAFLASLPADAPAGYWHDAGHADIKHAMGVIDHRAQLEKLSPRLVGFHLHDVSAEGQDHQPIGTGRVDFKMLSSFWRPEHVLVLELSPRLVPAAVRASRERLEALMA